ncbi:MAG: alpha/beta fold hydrolase [Anaerolineae bacterium]
MRLLRLIGTIIQAVLLISLSVLVLGTGYGYIAAGASEYAAPQQEKLEGQWLLVNGAPVHVVVAGPENGPVAVLLHGSDIEGALSFKANIKALGLAGVRVIALDFPGFGYSTRDPALGYMVADQTRLLEQVLITLNAKQVTLIGFQRGCAVALEYASNQPQNVKQIALISPVVYSSARPLANWVASMPVLGRALLWARLGGPLMPYERRSRFYDPSLVTPAYRSTIQGTTPITGTLAFQLIWLRDVRDDIIEALPTLDSLRIPTLILSGGADHSLAAQEAERLDQTLPDVKLVVMPDAGYYVHQEANVDVNQSLVSFCLRGTR